MATMGDEVDRTCPLCTEEMDLTDQQLKPCMCGYEICVWCWHHIINMAEKDNTEGRCPACRTPYDKKKVVGTDANCERLVAEMNAEKKQKFQKAKVKPSADARKHLSSVRVVQRNLVYIIGLPSNLCDENLLERREYFGQYGKVLKVSISRPNTTPGPQASNGSTFSVYITYSREEEAIRCIQAVHSFVLEGKPLRACFGTTKYCHAWLRNMTCSNPDCLYLHDVGCQEDSFTKDEIISAYTRSRVPPIAPNSLQRRSGTVLPPPVDDLCGGGSVSGKHGSKCLTNNAASQGKVSSYCSNEGKSMALPAAASWGLRVSNCTQATSTPSCSQDIVKQKVEALTSLSRHNSAWHDDIITTSKMPDGSNQINGKSRQAQTAKCGVSRDSESYFDLGHSFKTSAWDDDDDDCDAAATNIPEESSTVSPSDRLQPSEIVWRNKEPVATVNVSSDTTFERPNNSEVLVSASFNLQNPAASDMARDSSPSGSNTISPQWRDHAHMDKRNCDPGQLKITSCKLNDNGGNLQGLCLGLSSMNLAKCLGVQHSKMEPGNSIPNQCKVQILPKEAESIALSTKTAALSDTYSLREFSTWSSDLQNQALQPTMNKTDVVVPSNDSSQNLPDDRIKLLCSPLSYDPKNKTSSSNSLWSSFKMIDTSVAEDSRPDPLIRDNHLNVASRDSSILSNGHMEDKLQFSSEFGPISECSGASYTNEKSTEIFDNIANINRHGTVDSTECNIISDILSLDFDPWDDSLSAAKNLAKLLGESGKQDGPFKQLVSWKQQTATESRFSFARQESQANNLEPLMKDVQRVQSTTSSVHEPLADGYQNPSFFRNFGTAISTTNTCSVSSDVCTGVSKAMVSPPPGFSHPNRIPPPGFSSLDRLDQPYGSQSDHHLLGSMALRSQPQVHLTETTGDVEFMDPAILAVGKGRLPLGVNNAGFRSTSFPAQYSSFNNDLRLQMLMQNSSQHDPRFSNRLPDRFLPLNEPYISSRLSAENTSNFSSFAQLPFQDPQNLHILRGQWDGWGGARAGNDIAMTEGFRNDRFVLNNFFPGNEDHKFHMSNTGNTYNRAFGM